MCGFGPGMLLLGSEQFAELAARKPQATPRGGVLTCAVKGVTHLSQRLLEVRAQDV